MKNILCICLYSGALFCSATSFANDKVESHYDSKQFQSVCKNKTQGAEISFAYKGIIWNGTCETQFFPNNGVEIKDNEVQLNSVCRNDPEAKSINIEGVTYTGKCALGYAAPTPKNKDR